VWRIRFGRGYGWALGPKQDQYLLNTLKKSRQIHDAILIKNGLVWELMAHQKTSNLIIPDLMPQRYIWRVNFRRKRADVCTRCSRCTVVKTRGHKTITLKITIGWLCLSGCLLSSYYQEHVSVLNEIVNVVNSRPSNLKISWTLLSVMKIYL
jgi:ribosomal protein L28